MSKPLIGKRSEASKLLAYALERDWSKKDLLFARLQEKGWEYLGSGCYRTAFLSPSGVVYKVESGVSEGFNDGNADEIRRARQLYRANLGKDVVIPLVSGFSFKVNLKRHDATVEETVVIVAMQYMDGEHPPGCWYDAWDKRIHCDCGEVVDDDEGYGKKGEITDACYFAQTFERLRNLLCSSDIHNENVIRLRDGRFAVIDLQM